MSDPLAQLSAAGVSIWLDDLSRNRLRTGNLAELVRDRHVVGVTTNPSIFQKAISDSDAYDAQINDLATRGVDVGEALRSLTAHDVRNACDVLASVFDASGGVDGRVSIEVDPRIAHDTDKTIAEARELWWLVNRPNLYIKIPATTEGLPAISQGLAEGISINVTLIFGLGRYGEVIDAFLEGVERARSAGHDLHRLGSVASFFVSRVDSEVDARLDKLGTDEAKELRGQAAIANARLAYEIFEEKFSSDRWAELAGAGARVQRPLWASTSTKDPTYDDTMYVTQLVAPNCVNTMPGSTLEAVYDHSKIPADSIHGQYDHARQVIDRLTALGIEYDDVIGVLETEGVEKFETSWTELIGVVERALEAPKG